MYLSLALNKSLNDEAETQANNSRTKSLGSEQIGKDEAACGTLLIFFAIVFGGVLVLDILLLVLLVGAI